MRNQASRAVDAAEVREVAARTREACGNLHARKLVTDRSAASPSGRAGRNGRGNGPGCRLLVSPEPRALESLDPAPWAGAEGEEGKVDDTVRGARQEEGEERTRRRLRVARDGDDGRARDHGRNQEVAQFAPGEDFAPGRAELAPDAIEHGAPDHRLGDDVAGDGPHHPE